MAAHCFARYRFRLNRVLYFLIFSTIIFPPQITIIALFQILVQYGLYNTLAGLIAVYVAVQLPLTVYILESFFARIPGDLFDAARIDVVPDEAEAVERAVAAMADGDLTVVLVEDVPGVLARLRGRAVPAAV